MKTNHLVKYENGLYEIDDINGWIPAVKFDDDNGEMLFVCTKALKFDMLNKIVQWEVKELIYNTVSNKWVELTGDTKTGRFVDISGFSTMTVIDETTVNKYTGIYCEPNDVDAIGEATFYLNTLGKLAIFPAITTAITYKLN